MTIRPYHPADITALFDICLKTGNSGRDATSHFRDKEILGLYYAAPYVAYQPSLCFILSREDTRPVGYILGTSDTARFSEWAEERWFPLLRQRYVTLPENFTDRDRHIAELIRRGYPVKEALKDYPAHLHIDILPEGQGGGMGRRLMETFIRALKENGVPALHLEVGKANPRAIDFYRHLGFHTIVENEKSLALGMRLT